eukprot:jgi/Ulvmu1/2917/UM148_0001.1
MGGIKDREAKKKANHVYSGGSGGGTKGASIVDKRKQQLQCPYCERIFQHKDRYQAHLTSKHADETANADPQHCDGPEKDAVSSSGGKVMQANSKAGYYTKKSPHLFLLEQCQSDKRSKPKIKVLSKGNGNFGCRIIFPHPNKAELDEFVYLPDELLADNEEDAKERGSLAGLNHIAGHRALERVLPEDFLKMWARLGELREEKQARAASRAAREEEQQAKKARQKVMEMKHLQNKNIVSIGSDRIEEMYRVVCSDKMSASMADPGGCVPLDPQTVKHMKEIGCTDDHVHSVTLGLQRGGGLQEALDWLCMHVSEDELPALLRQKHGSSSVRVKLTSGQANTASAGRSSRPGAHCLKRMGYSQQDADSALQLCAGASDAVAQAWKRLFEVLAGCDLGQGAPCDKDVLHWFGAPADQSGAAAEAVIEPQWPEPDDATHPQAKAWWDEQYVFTSVFPDEVLHASEHCVVMQLPVLPAMVQAYGRADHTARDGQHRAELALMLWGGCGYPKTLPLISLRCSVLPQAVLLHFTAAVAKHLQTACPGMEMLHEAHSHLQELLQAEPPSAIFASLQWGALLRSLEDVAERRAAEVLKVASDSKRGETDASARHRCPAAPASGHAKRESERLTRLMQDNSTTGPGRKMLAARQKLPAYSKRQEVLTAVADHRVTVISGATGCGKSTQVPQFILEHEIENGRGGAANIICTQPRRLPAIALANRVSDEMLQKPGSTVGYSIRLEKKMSKQTHLLFCTTGILLRRLMSDQELADVTHIIVDEVHERSLDSDLLLLMLRDMLRDNSRLRLVLMSATADADLFARYFEGAIPLSVGLPPACTLEIPGFTYPVRELQVEDILSVMCRHGRQVKRKSGKLKEADIDKRLHRLEVLNAYTDIPCNPAVLQAIAETDEFSIDYELVEATIAQVIEEDSVSGENAFLEKWHGLKGTDLSRVGKLDGPGAILVFLPGSMEISKLQKQLQVSSRLKAALDGDEAKILPLHGMLAPAQQQAVFRRYGRGCRKIVLSTNIAETSVTIDDITIVIDTGKMKEIQVDKASGISRLADTWVSKAAAKQRRGRAGRVRPGVCIRLFSRLQWEALSPHQLPEMKRVPLEPLCLQIKATLPQRRIADVLAEALTPPDPAVVQQALDLLVTRQLITGPNEHLSALGHHISRIPLDPALGKMLIYAAILRCTDPVLTVAAAIGHGRPVFLSPESARAEANAARKTIIGDSLAAKSDHISTVHAFAAFLQARAELGDRGAQQWCRDSFVSYDAMVAIHDGRCELVKSLLEVGFVEEDYVRCVRGGGSVDYSDPHDRNSSDARVVKAAICAGFYPQILRVENPASKYAKVAGGAFETDQGHGIPKLFERAQGRVFVHPSSVNAGVTKFDTGWMVFTEIVQTAK